MTRKTSFVAATEPAAVTSAKLVKKTAVATNRQVAPFDAALLAGQLAPSSIAMYDARFSRLPSLRRLI